MTGRYDPARHDCLLGTMTDQALADLVGISKAAITKRRNAKGVPSYTAQTVPASRAFDELLGTLPDRAVAHLAGLAAATVAQRRAKLGIASYWQGEGKAARRADRAARPKLRPGRGAIPWAHYDRFLGTMYDQDLAAVLHIAPRTILNRRKARGLPSYRDLVPALQQLGELMGQVPDDVLAERSGLPVEAIRRHRLAMGYGIDRRRRGRYDPERHDVILGMIADAELAARIGVSAQSIAQRRRELAVPVAAQ